MASGMTKFRRAAGRASRIALGIAGLGLIPARALAEDPAAAGRSGLAVPRFVSLKSDRVNLRQGPSGDHKIVWVFRRAGLPVEVVKESEGWRQVRDSEGTIGWVQGNMLSGRRTVTVQPWEVGKAAAGAAAAKTAASPVPLFARDAASSGVVANVEPGVIASVVACTGEWCRISVGDLKGFIEQKKLWGVYVGEAIK